MEETLNGLTVTLTDDATMDNYGTDGEVRYYASAVDAAGNEYRVAWDTTDGYNQWYNDCKRFDSLVDDQNHGWRNILPKGMIEEILMLDSDTIDLDIVDRIKGITDRNTEDAREIHVIIQRQKGLPEDNSRYANDESSNCDWDNPVAIDAV